MVRARSRRCVGYVCAALLASLLVMGSVTGTPPPEIQNQQFISKTAMTWSSEPAATGYNLYRGMISALPGSYGTCLQPNLPTPNATDAAVPATGTCFQYLVTGINGLGEEGTFGFMSAGPERPNTTPCPGGGGPTVLHDLLHPNGATPDGVLQGVEAPRNPSIANDLTNLVGGGLYLHTSEYFAQVVDLEIPGRGMNYRMVRTYRSQINHDGQVGYNWVHNYDRRLVAPGGPDLLYLDGEGRQDEYAPVGGALYEPLAAGIYAKIRQNLDGSWSMRERDGTIYRHHALDASPLSGVLVGIDNRLGDHISLLYDPFGRLQTIVDTYGRSITYSWFPSGRLQQIQDYSGRTVSYAYDANGNLTSVTRPAVTGTSTGNDFPAGKTTSYTYASGTGNPRLDHNLLTIRAPGDGTPSIQNSYNANDELQTQLWGGTNASGIPAGGTSHYSISILGGGARRINVIDRTNVVHVFETDVEGHATKEQINTIGLRPTDPPVFETRHTYNSQGERIITNFPLSNSVSYIYDSSNPDRFQRGNLTSIGRFADPVRGDGFGGALGATVVSYAYEPLATQQSRITDPLGRVSTYIYDYQEASSGLSGITAYASAWNINLGSIALGLGDANGDGTLETCAFSDPATAFRCGNPEVLQQPTVTLLAGGKQAAIEGSTSQPITTVYRYNAQHQIRAEIEPELNVKTYVYYPETDPDGDGVTTPPPLDGRILAGDDGGMLHISTVDDDPTPHLTPAQITRRDNALAPPWTAIRNDYLYDQRGNLVASIDGNGVQTSFEVNQLGQIVAVRRGQVSFRALDPSPSPVPPGGFVSYQYFNARDEIVRRSVQDSFLSDSFFDVFITLDILGNTVTTVQDISNVQSATTQYRYDAMGRRTSITFPEGNINTMKYDERSLIFRLVRGDNDLDAGNGGPAGSSLNVYNYDQNGNPNQYVDGRGASWNFVYDGMDRRVRSPVVPTASSFFDVNYNADESISMIRVRQGANTLYDALYFYDEMGRVKEVRQGIRNNTGALILGEDLNNDGYASQMQEYDRNSRRTRSVADLGQRRDFDYDGAGHVVRTYDPLLNQTSYVYDDNHNVLSTAELEHGPTGDETRSASSTYDRLNRKKTAADALGQIQSFTYDARDNVVGLEDALHNTISYEYDARGNRTRVVRDMRPGGHGPGPIIDQIIYQTAFDRNGRLTSVTDPNSRVTSYQYDALDRKTRDTFDDATIIQYAYDPNDNLASITDANGSIISITYDTMDRPTQKVVAPAAGVHGSSVGYAYDGMNRLVNVLDQNDGGAAERTTVSLTYDSLNRVRTESSQYGSNPLRTLTFFYDGNGNRRQAGYPSDALTYIYDPLDRIQHVQDSVAGFAADYSYLGAERVAERRYNNTTRKSYLDPPGLTDIGYDPLKRTKSIRHYNAGGSVLAGFDYGWDAQSNMVSETRTHHLNRGDVWIYDSAYRLVDFKRDADNAVAEQSAPGSGGLIRHRQEYTLDKVGNWLNHRIDGGPLLGNTPNNLNEYDEPQSGGTRVDDGIANDFGDNTGTPGPDGVNLGHDKNGDLIREGTKTYEYDAFHRLVTVRNSAVITAHYVYDGLNRRMVKQNVTAGVRSRFVYDGDRIVHEYDLNAANIEGALKRRFFSGPDNPYLAFQNALLGQLFYLHEDERHSSVMLTNTAGTVVERVEYDAYGAPTFLDAASNPTGAVESPSGNPFLYSGQYYDAETQFYENRAAIFAPRFGRHIQRFVPGQMMGPQVLAYHPPMVFPLPIAWPGMNPFWWCKNWFWHPGFWWGGWWAWRPFWWWGGGCWGWWRWQPWVWFVGGGYDWWTLRPWWTWWGAPFRWWGWQAWWGWGGWWGWWPWWGWGGWGCWLPAWGWLGWCNWWPWWGWGGWCGWWLGFGWWGWGGWWPWWNGWWCWHPWWWCGWWTWMPWWWFGWWGWCGVTWWWNWWFWIAWRPWKWFCWFGWGWWWGWWGWNPWWWCGWWGWWWWGWNWGWYWWWGPWSWNPWWWGWMPWWYFGWYNWFWPWTWWAWGWWGWTPVWSWSFWWTPWWWLRRGFGWWGWGRFWGWWWPWWWWW